MSDTVIKVEDLGKKYIISHEASGKARYKTFRDVLAGGVTETFNRLTGQLFNWKKSSLTVYRFHNFTVQQFNEASL